MGSRCSKHLPPWLLRTASSKDNHLCLFSTHIWPTLAPARRQQTSHSLLPPTLIFWEGHNHVQMGHCSGAQEVDEVQAPLVPLPHRTTITVRKVVWAEVDSTYCNLEFGPALFRISCINFIKENSGVCSFLSGHCKFLLSYWLFDETALRSLRSWHSGSDMLRPGLTQIQF